MAQGKTKTVTLTDVQVFNISLFRNEAGKWILRAFYQVVDENRSARGSGWIEVEPAQDGQTSLRALADALTAEVKEKEGI